MREDFSNNKNYINSKEEKYDTEETINKETGNEKYK